MRGGPWVDAGAGVGVAAGEPRSAATMAPMAMAATTTRAITRIDTGLRRRGGVGD